MIQQAAVLRSARAVVVMGRERLGSALDKGQINGSEDIIAAICSHLKVSREDLLQKSGENKKIAIYLMKKLTGMSNKQIGHLFGGLSYSAVSKVYQRFSAEAKTNKPLRKLLKELRT